MTESNEVKHGPWQPDPCADHTSGRPPRMWWSTPAGRTFCLHRMSASEPVRGRIRSRTIRTGRCRRRRCRPNLNCEHIHGLVRMVWGSWICVDETKERERERRGRTSWGWWGVFCKCTQRVNVARVFPFFPRLYFATRTI